VPLWVSGADAVALPEGGREALEDGVEGAVGELELDNPALREAEAPEDEALPRAEALPVGGREALADGVVGAEGDPELDCAALREAEAPEGEALPRAVRERVAAPEDVPLPPLPEGLLRGEADGLGEEDGHAVAEGGAEADGDEEPHGDGRGEAEAEPHAEAPPLGVCAAVEEALPLPLRLGDVLPVGDALRPPLRLGDTLPVGDALPPTLRLGEAQGEGEGVGRGERDVEALREDAPLEDAQKEGFAEGEAQNEEDAAEEKEGEPEGERVGAALRVGLRLGSGERVGGSGVAVAARDSEAEVVGVGEREGGDEREGEPDAEAVDLPRPTAPEAAGAPSGGDGVGALVLLPLPQMEGEAVDEVEWEGDAEVEGEPEDDNVDAPLAPAGEAEGAPVPLPLPQGMGEWVSRKDGVPLAEGHGELETRGEREGEEDVEGEGGGDIVTDPLPEDVGLLLRLALPLADAGSVAEARDVALSSALGEPVAVTVGCVEEVPVCVNDDKSETEAHCDAEGEPEAVSEDCQSDAEGGPELEALPLEVAKEDSVAPPLGVAFAECPVGSAEGVPSKRVGDVEGEIAPVALAGAGVPVPSASLPLARGEALSVRVGDCEAVAMADKEGEPEDEGQCELLRESIGEDEKAGEGVAEKERGGERELAGVPVGGAAVGDAVGVGATRVAEGANPVFDGAPDGDSAPVVDGRFEAVEAPDALAELDPPPSKHGVGVAPLGGEAEGAGELLVRPLPEPSTGDCEKAGVVEGDTLGPGVPLLGADAEAAVEGEASGEALPREGERVSAPSDALVAGEAVPETVLLLLSAGEREAEPEKEPLLLGAGEPELVGDGGAQGEGELDASGEADGEGEAKADREAGGEVDAEGVGGAPVDDLPPLALLAGLPLGCEVGVAALDREGEPVDVGVPAALSLARAERVLESESDGVAVDETLRVCGGVAEPGALCEGEPDCFKDGVTAGDCVDDAQKAGVGVPTGGDGEPVADGNAPLGVACRDCESPPVADAPPDAVACVDTEALGEGVGEGVAQADALRVSAPTEAVPASTEEVGCNEGERSPVVDASSESEGGLVPEGAPALPLTLRLPSAEDDAEGDKLEERVANLVPEGTPVTEALLLVDALARGEGEGGGEREPLSEAAGELEGGADLLPAAVGESGGDALPPLPALAVPLAEAHAEDNTVALPRVDTLGEAVEEGDAAGDCEEAGEAPEERLAALLREALAHPEWVREPPRGEEEGSGEGEMLRVVDKVAEVLPEAVLLEERAIDREDEGHGLGVREGGGEGVTDALPAPESVAAGEAVVRGEGEDDAEGAADAESRGERDTGTDGFPLGEAEPPEADGELEVEGLGEARALPLLALLREALPVLLPDALAQRDADGDTDEERVFSGGVAVGATESEGLPEAEGDAETVCDE
jgi:hypothetical protein